MKSAIRVLGAAIVLALGVSAADAQTAYPSRPVRVIVSLPAGSAIDVVARIVTPKLSEVYGQQFIVDNRAGATGNIAAELTARSAPDGQTLLIVHGGIAINQTLFPKLNYNLEKDFAPVGLFAEVPQVLTVHPSLPVSNVKELIAFLKQKPRQFQYGSNGNGSTPHLTMELFKMQAEVDVTHVPYKGTPQALADEITGRIGMTFFSMLSVQAHVQAGRLRALAITSAKRSPAAPDLPTFVESGLPGLVVNTWYGMLAPAGTPRNIVASLNRELMNVIRAPDVSERLASQSVNTVTSTPDEFAGVYQSGGPQMGQGR
jgi:tripartite-type tricarboxylate transporter receptor subunit TctC